MAEMGRTAAWLRGELKKTELEEGARQSMELWLRDWERLSRQVEEERSGKPAAKRLQEKYSKVVTRPSVDSEK